MEVNSNIQCRSLKTNVPANSGVLNSNNSQNSVNNNSVHIDAKVLSSALKAQTFASSQLGYKELQPFDVPFYDIKGKFYQLDNGQKVVIIPKPGPTTIKTFVKVGSFNETDKIRGISHYIEHNLFNGSKQLKPGEFVKITNQMGAKYNAGTDFSGTNYFILSPLHKKGDLEKFINMHADMLENPSFLQDQLDKEKGPVISEIQMYKDNPFDVGFNKVLRNLFNIGDESSNLIAGNEKSIRELTKEDVVDYYNKWYTPDNMTTVIVGEVNPEQTIKLVSNSFNSTKRTTDPSEKHYESLTNTLQQTKRVDVKSPHINSSVVLMGFVGPKNNDLKEWVNTKALSVALSGYKNSKLKKALINLNTSADVSLNMIGPKDTDPMVIGVAANFKPGDEEKGLNTIYSVIHEMTQRPITQPELEIIKNKLKDAYISSCEYSMELAEMIGQSTVVYNNPQFFAEIPKLIDSLTIQDIQNAAKRYLDLNKTSIVVLHPQNQVINVPANKNIQQSAVKQIAFGSGLNKLNIGNVTQYKLPNNVHLALNDDNSSIKTSVILEFSTDYPPNTKPGVKEVLETLLEKGTQLHSEDAISNEMDVNNLIISPAVASDSIQIAASAPNDKVSKAMDLMKEIILMPNFTEQKLNRAKEEIKVALMTKSTNPKSRAMETLYKNHPYGYSSRMVLENIDSITLQDVVNYYNYIIKNAQIKAVATAPFSKQPDLKNKIFSALQIGLPNCQPYHYINTFKTQPLDHNIIITQSEDRNQAHIVQMFKINESGNIKDKVTLALLNKILGGSSESRLFTDLRESQKLAYRVGSNYSTNGKTSQITLDIKTSTKDIVNGKTITQYENIQKSIDGFKKHINKLINTPVSAEELEGAKLALKSELIFSAESSLGKTSLIFEGLRTPYGISYKSDLLNTIDTITPEDIQKAANLFLNKPSVISLVASKDTIENTKDYLSSLGEYKAY